MIFSQDSVETQQRLSRDSVEAQERITRNSEETQLIGTLKKVYVRGTTPSILHLYALTT